MIRRVLLPAAALLVLAGTASAQTGDTATVVAPPAADSAHAAPKPAAPRRARPRMNVLTREEIAEVHVADMYVLIERLRASWLNAPGGAQNINDPGGTKVAFNGSIVGNLSALTQYTPEQISTARFYTSSEARTRFGPGSERGVIALTGI